MKSYLSRLFTLLGQSDVLTHTLPYANRVTARKSGRA